MFRVIAIKFDGEDLAREFDNLESAERFFDSIMVYKVTQRYKKVAIINGSGREFVCYRGIPQSEAKAFYDCCREIWHDGAVSKRLIADTLNVFPSTVDRMLSACLVWDLPVSKASGMWVF